MRMLDRKWSVWCNPDIDMDSMHAFSSQEHVMVYVEVCSPLVPWSGGTYKHVINAGCDVRAFLLGSCLAMRAFHPMMHQNWGGRKDGMGDGFMAL